MIPWGHNSIAFQRSTELQVNSHRVVRSVGVTKAGSKKMFDMFLRNDHSHSKCPSPPVRSLSKDASPTRYSYSRVESRM